VFSKIFTPIMFSKIFTPEYYVVNCPLKNLNRNKIASPTPKGMIAPIAA
jgi:hypothetical protein